MKALVWVASITASLALATAAQANLIEDGDFSQPNQYGGWSFYSGGIDGWQNQNGDGIEIGYSPIYGLPCDNGGCQNLEVNANTFDTDSQIVGLSVGQTYDLSWAYGGRTSGGPDTLLVYFGSKLVATDTGSSGVWTVNAFSVVATSSSESLTFASVDDGGDPSYGNEITNVSLTAAPLPAAFPLFAGGLGIIGLVAGRKKRKAAAAISVA